MSRLFMVLLTGKMGPKIFFLECNLEKQMGKILILRVKSFEKAKNI